MEFARETQEDHERRVQLARHRNNVIDSAARLVVTKSPETVRIGNDSVFVRVRRRRRSCWYRGTQRSASVSYELVHAVRINGKPRHRFVVGFGSMLEPASNYDLLEFWCGVVTTLTSPWRGFCLTGEALSSIVRLVASRVPLLDAEAFITHADSDSIHPSSASARTLVGIVSALPVVTKNEVNGHFGNDGRRPPESTGRPITEKHAINLAATAVERSAA